MDPKGAHPDLILWARFFAASTDEELDALAQESPIMKKAVAALDKLSADPLARRLAEERERQKSEK